MIHPIHVGDTVHRFSLAVLTDEGLDVCFNGGFFHLRARLNLMSHSDGSVSGIPSCLDLPGARDVFLVLPPASEVFSVDPLVHGLFLTARGPGDEPIPFVDFAKRHEEFLIPVSGSTLPGLFMVFRVAFTQTPIAPPFTVLPDASQDRLCSGWILHTANAASNPGGWAALLLELTTGFRLPESFK